MMLQTADRFFRQHNLFAPATKAILMMLLLLNLACNRKTPRATEPYKNNLGIKPANLAQIDTVHYTVIKWIDSEKDFGTLNYGDSIILTYRFTNLGEHPLFVYSIKPSCGCTVAQFPDKATWPGDTSVIVIRFNTIGQAEDTEKTIAVTTNTLNGTKNFLSFHGKVRPPTKEIIDSLQKLPVKY